MADVSLYIEGQGTIGFADTQQDIQDSITGAITTYGGTVDSLQVLNGSIFITLTVPDTKTVAQEIAMLAQLRSDLGGEWTISSQMKAYRLF